MDKKDLFGNPTITETRFLDDILDVLQERVNLIVKSKYKNDTCQPTYTVSVLFGEEKKYHKIILTITHGSSFSQQIFPKNSIFDYFTLEEEMESLYNATI